MQTRTNSVAKIPLNNDKMCQIIVEVLMSSYKVDQEFEKSKLRQTEEMLYGQHEILEMLAVGIPLDDCLKTLILNMESQVEGIVGAVFKLDETRKYFNTLAAPSLPKEVRLAFDGFEVDEKIGSCGPAVILNKAVVVENIQTDPKWEGYRDFAEANEFRGCWSTPIRDVKGQPIGTLCCFFNQPRKPYEEEIDIVNIATYLAGIAIQMKELETVKSKAEEQNRKSLEQMRSIMEGTSAHTGEDFFKSLVYQLAVSLNVKYTLVTQNKGKMNKAIAFWKEDQFASNLEYDTSDCPCGAVIQQKTAQVIASNFLKLYPKMTLLKELGVESYLGIPLVNSTGDVMGNLIVMDTKPLVDPSQAQMIMTIFASRAEAEIIRIQIEEALVNGKQKLEKANLAKSEFLARMSHELRTPMNSILGFSQMLQINANSKLSPIEVENIRKINKAGQHLLSLINDILDLNQIEADKLPVASKSIQLHKLVHDAIDLMQPVAEDHKVELVCEGSSVDSDNVFVLADPLRLKQVLLNLISNGIKFSPAGSSVNVSFGRTENKKVYIHVKDFGKGIPQEFKEKLFDPFERFSDDTPTTEGTGIGLTITKKLLGLMNGDIDFESELNQGTTFRVLLPEGESYREEVATETESQPLPERDKAKALILYIEDNVTNLSLMESIFSYRKNVHLITASEALKGLELAQEHQPDLILLDINLPGMDGISAMRELQKFEKTKHIPVIAVSANANQADIDRTLSEGFQTYIAKPFEVQSFLEIIDKTLENPNPSQKAIA